MPSIELEIDLDVNHPGKGYVKMMKQMDLNGRERSGHHEENYL